MRGLKLTTDTTHVLHGVAPYVGAWIETRPTYRENMTQHVAPYVGAWIETPLVVHLTSQFQSHPTWVRGLKLVCSTPSNCAYCRTLRGCVD